MDNIAKNALEQVNNPDPFSNFNNNFGLDALDKLGDFKFGDLDKLSSKFLEGENKD